jgi:MFS family permease
VYTIGLLVFVAASALCGLAPSLRWLIGARAAQAIGGALLTPAALALVLPEFPMEKRSAAIGVWGSIGSIAAATGPVVGGWLVDRASWRAAFFVNVPIGIIAFLVGRRVLRESRDEQAQGIPDIVSIASGIGAVALVALAISKGNEWGYVGSRARWCFGLAAVLLPLFIWRSRVARLPVLDLSLLRSRAFTVANMSTFLYSVPFYGSVVANRWFRHGIASVATHRDSCRPPRRQAV